MKKLKSYEIIVPIKETWYFQVDAVSKKAALKKYNDQNIEVQQVCSMGGWTKRKLTVREIK